MESFMDALTAIVGRAAAPWVGVFLLSLPLWPFGLWGLRKSRARRRAFQDFAAARNFRFVGTILSDVRAPYTRLRGVRAQGMLRHVVEGQSNGLSIYLFDGQPQSRSYPPFGTMVLVTVEGKLRRGTAAERTIASGPAALIEADIDVLLVSAERYLDASELSAWLWFATTLAKAMERDAMEVPDGEWYAS
jgi:hypothetical protein